METLRQTAPTLVNTFVPPGTPGTTPSVQGPTTEGTVSSTTTTSTAPPANVAAPAATGATTSGGDPFSEVSFLF